MGDPYASQDENAVATNNGTQPVCSKCKQPGHKRPTNKLCAFYRPRVLGADASTTTGTTEDDSKDAIELDLMDDVGFDGDDEFFDSFEEEPLLDGPEDDEDGPGELSAIL